MSWSRIHALVLLYQALVDFERSVGVLGVEANVGGLRILYYFHAESHRVLLLFVFAKNERADLTKSQRDQLRKIVESEYP